MYITILHLITAIFLLIGGAVWNKDDILNISIKVILLIGGFLYGIEAARSLGLF